MTLILPRRVPTMSPNLLRSTLISGTSSGYLRLNLSGGTALHATLDPLLQPRFFSLNPRKNPSRTVLFALKSSGFRPLRQLSSNRDVHYAPLDAETDIEKRFEVLRAKLEELGFPHTDCIPGQYNSRMCPKCGGGDSEEKSFSFFIQKDGRCALWRCFRGKCGWSGSIQGYEDGKMQSVRQAQTVKARQYRVLMEKDLNLEPLCEEILAYLNERMISAETLRRNAVMQRSYKNETVIAFPYRRNGVIVSCKYRGIDKRFWQELNTERIFYGLDDIRNAKDIIIVEGEMDKLAMEEAGYRNCVSVPDGAPGKVSVDIPKEEKLGHEVPISMELQRVSG